MTGCISNSLLINTSKTTEIVVTDIHHHPNPPKMTTNNSEIECVGEYKRLGTIPHHKLNFASNISNNIITRTNKRLYIMKQMGYMNVSLTIMNLA